MLEVKKQQAKIGGHINVRSEKHGDDSVPGFDVSLEFLVSAAGVNGILGEGSFGALFKKPKGGPTEPRWRDIKPIHVTRKFENADVTIWGGMENKAIKFKGVKLASITIEPQVGGMALVCCQMQCTPDLGPQLDGLVINMDHEISLQIDGARAEKIKAAKQQPELPLGEKAEKPKRGKKTANGKTAEPTQVIVDDSHASPDQLDA